MTMPRANPHTHAHATRVHALNTLLQNLLMVQLLTWNISAYAEHLSHTSSSLYVKKVNSSATFGTTKVM